MNHEERINALLLSEVPDRTPVSFWRHFFHKESTAEGLAEAMLSFQNEFDWDFMKVNPRASYHIEVWKAELEFSGDEFIKPRIARYPVKNSFDWDRINPQKPDNPAFAEQLQALNLISRGLGGKVYFVQTVFSPLSIAGDLVNEPWELINEMK